MSDVYRLAKSVLDTDIMRSMISDLMRLVGAQDGVDRVIEAIAEAVARVLSRRDFFTSNVPVANGIKSVMQTGLSEQGKAVALFMLGAVSDALVTSAPGNPPDTQKSYRKVKCPVCAKKNKEVLIDVPDNAEEVTCPECGTVFEVRIREWTS